MEQGTQPLSMPMNAVPNREAFRKDTPSHQMNQAHETVLFKNAHKKKSHCHEPTQPSNNILLLLTANPKILGSFATTSPQAPPFRKTPLSPHPLPPPLPSLLLLSHPPPPFPPLPPPKPTTTQNRSSSPPRPTPRRPGRSSAGTRFPKG